MNTLSFSQACENNKQPILEVITPYLTQVDEVLEVGSGTGQHAVHFASNLPHLTWQTSDRLENHTGITARLNEAQLSNVLPPLNLNVNAKWPVTNAKAIFSANTTHIMHWPEVVAFFNGVGQVLKANGYFILYGPFNFCGEYTCDSNQAFDQKLKSQNEGMGLRDFVDLEELAQANGLMFVEKHDMPANNFILVWQKTIDLIQGEL